MTLRDEYLKPFRYQQQNYKRDKLLPHISEEFIFRRRNKLLVDRIINPQRDKIIMRSLDRCVRKHNRSFNFRYLSSPKPARQDQNRTSEEVYRRNNDRKEGKCSRTFHHALRGTGGAVVRNIHKQKQENLQKQSIFYRPIRPNLILDEDKENQLEQVSILQEKKCRQAQKLQEESPDIDYLHMQSLHMQSTHKAPHIKSYGPPKHSPLQTFGNGPTIICFSRLKIISNPPIKPQSLLILELIEKPFLDKVSEEKTMRTAPIPYRYLMDNEVKFAVKISSIGDFIPLRIWQCSGVECIEIGLLGLNLTYNPGMPQADSYIQRKGFQFYRQVYSQSVERQLNRTGACHVSIHYKVYSKRFKKCQQ